MPSQVVTSPLSILIVFGELAVGTTLQRSGAALVERLREDGFDDRGALGAGWRGGD